VPLAAEPGMTRLFICKGEGTATLHRDDPRRPGKKKIIRRTVKKLVQTLKLQEPNTGQPFSSGGKKKKKKRGNWTRNRTDEKPSVRGRRGPPAI